MDRGAWWATVHRVTKSRTQLSNFTHMPPFLIWQLESWTEAEGIVPMVTGPAQQEGILSFGVHL